MLRILNSGLTKAFTHPFSFRASKAHTRPSFLINCYGIRSKATVTNTTLTPAVCSLEREVLQSLERQLSEERTRTDRLVNEERARADRLIDEERARTQAERARVEQYIINYERLKVQAMITFDEKLHIGGNFNLRGALERVTYQAVVHGVVSKGTGVQDTLNKIAQTPGFKHTMARIIAKYEVSEKDVLNCFSRLYHQASKDAHSNNGNIIIHKEHFTINELAALSTIFTEQQTWPAPMQWEICTLQNK